MNVRAKRATYDQKVYPYKCADAAISPSTGEVVVLETARVVNNTSAAMGLGVCKRFKTGDYRLLQIQGSVTDITSTVDAGTATEIFSTTNNHGFLIQSRQKFNVIGFNVAQESTGSPVYTIQYYNGSSYQTLATIDGANFSATGYAIISFLAPFDWVVGSTGVTGASSTEYSVKVLATTAPSQAVQADSVWAAQFLAYAPSVASKGALTFNALAPYFVMLESGEGIAPYFSTANSQNFVELAYVSQE